MSKKADGKSPTHAKVKKHNRVKTKNDYLLVDSSAVLICESDKDKWYAYNWVTNHITNQRELFESVE